MEHIAPLIIGVRALIFLLGLEIALATLLSAIKTCILPGRKKVRLSRAVFRQSFRLFRFVSLHVATEARRDAILAMYAPTSAMLLPLIWVILLILGYAAMFWALGATSISRAMTLGGAALTTEGFATPSGVAQSILYIVAGVVGLGIVSLLITFLPSAYTVYAQREHTVTQIAFCCGTPPSGVKLLTHVHHLGLDDELAASWHTWEEWFIGIHETHLSIMQVVFYRSSQPDSSWITTAGAILDACALFSSTIALPDAPWLILCFQAGCLTLQEVAADLHGFLDMALDEGTMLHVTRAQFDDACRQLQQAGIPLKSDQEACWRAFSTMRCQYDAPLLALADFLYAPQAPWNAERVR